MRQEFEQVAAREDPEHLAGLLDQDRGTVLEGLERELDRRVELDQADRRPHDLGDVGLQGVGVAEDAVEECVLVDAADELRDVDPRLANDGGLRDVVLVQHVDRLADLVPRVHGDERRDVAVLGRQDLLHAHDLGPFHQPVLEQPGVGVGLREVVPAGVGEDHDHRGPGRQLGRDRERRHDGGPRG